MMLSQSIPLKKYCNYHIGGLADYYYEFSSADDLVKAIKEYRQIEPEGNIFVLGTGTNILFSDQGYTGLVLKDNIKFINRLNDEDGKIIVEVGSGTLVEELVNYCINNALTGFEWAGGLPGSIGGAIRGNAGAFGGETKDNVQRVISINRNSYTINFRSNGECEFDYRMSVFKKEKGVEDIVLSAIFQFVKGDEALIKQETQSHIDYRIDRHPLDLPSIGSTFKNVPIAEVPSEVLEKFKNYIKDDPFPVLPVAKLLVDANLMGETVGDAQISTKHPNFIVNLGKAKAEDVKTLIETVKKTIKHKYDINLEEEIMVIPA